MDLTRVYQALQNADAAGDTEAAKQLANFIKTQQQADEAESRRLQKEYGPGVVGTFGRAVKRGAGELASTVTDIIPAAIGSALGFEGYAKEQLEEAAQKRAAREAEAPTLFRSYKEVEGLGDVPRFVSETIGEQVPNILTSLIPGAGVGVAAGRTAATSAAKALTAQAAQRGLVGEAAEQFVAQGLKAAAPQIAQSASRGQVAGLALGSYAQNAPEIFQNIYENTGELAPGAAAIFGAASAALDSVLPAKLLKQLTGPMKAGIVEKVLEKSGMDKGLLRSVTAGALTGVPAEGLTEGMQEAISIYAENFVAKNPQVFGSKEWDRVMESAVKGAVAGGAFGAVGGAGERARAAAERREAYAQSLERRGQRQLAAEVRRQSAEIEAIQAQEPQMQLPGFEAGPAAGLYTPPEPEPKAPKELKGRQAELFTAEGELAPAVAKAATRDEKIEANKQRLAAQREAAQVKEAQAKLKKFLSAKQAELPLGEPIPLQPPVPAPDTTGQFDLFRPSAPAAQAQAEAETLTKTTRPITTPVVTPEVRPAPSLESITKIDDLKAFGKLLGIGPTARILRADGPLAGKDLSNPADAAEVKRTLEAYASGKPAAGAAEKIDTFLKRPEFQGAADVARPVEPPSGAGAGVPSEPAAGAAPGAAEQVEPSGVVPAGAVAEQPAGREVLEPVAVEAAREEAAGVPVEAAAAPAVEEPSAAPVTEAVAEPEPGKKAKADLAKAEKGAEEAVKEQATFAQEVDQRTNDVLMGQLRTAARGAGLTDADVPSESFLGTDIHNALRLPPLLNEFFRLQEVVRQEGGDPAQRRKNAQEMEAVKQEIAKSGMNPDEAIATLVNLNPTQRDKMLSELNRQALNEFAREIEGRMPAFRAKREAQEKAKSKKEAVKSAEQLEDEAADAMYRRVYERISPSPKITESVQREVDRLPENQVKALETAYGAARGSAPFMQKLQQDIVNYVVRGAEAITKTIRAAVKKVAEGVMAVAIVFNPNINATDFSFNLPAVYAKTVQEGTREVRARVPANAADKMSTTAKGVYESMAPVAMESGKGFIIADKQAGMLHAFNPDGSLLAQESALYGKDVGDVLGKSSLIGGPKITPAGKFTLQAAKDSGYTGGYTFRLAESEDPTGFVAVHAVYVGNPAENRVKRLASNVPAEKRVSFGCINTTNDMFLNKLIPKTEQFNGGMIFVLPDSSVRMGMFAPKTVPAFKTVKETVPGAHKERTAEIVGREEKLLLPKYEGPTFDQTQRGLAETGNVNGLLRSMLDQIKDPAIKQVLRKLRSLNLKTKLVIGNPEGPMAVMRGSKAPDWVPQSIWDLHEKSLEADEKARYYNYGPVKTTATKASNRLLRAVRDYIPGDEQAQLNLMVRMNEESSRREGAGDRNLQFAPTKAGSYDPATNTITLDPINGMNAHTFIHEAVHAAISNVLASPNHPLTKEFEKFFVSIQDRLGAAYGAQDLQEFAAELISNPSFQAVLKSIKTPKSESMFMRVLRSIAEFFGFKGKTALDEGLKFVSDAIDISKDVGPTASEKMFLGMGNFSTVGQIGQAMPRLAGNVVEQTKNTLSNIKEVGVLQAALGMLRLDNLNTLYSKDLPSLQKLIDALELRNGTQEQRIKAVNDNYKKFVDVERKHPAAMSRMSDLAIEARLEEVDLSKAHISKQVPAAAWVRMSATAKQEFLANEKKREVAHKRLMAQFSTLPDDVQNVYRTMRADFDKSLTEYRNIIIKNASPTLAQRLANEFQNLRGVIGYVPFLRHGDFWVEYADPQTGERAASAFESVRERQQFIDSTLKPQGIQHRAYQNLQSISYDSQSIPPTSFIGRVLKDLQDQGADQAQLDSVYQAYLTLFPGESILKQFMKAKNVRGMERDMVRNYGDIMIRWARKLSNSEYMPQINQALGEIATQGEQSGNLQVEEAAKTVLRQGDFFRNPTYSTAVQAATQFSYFEYIAGNISSALINLTSLPLLVWPILSGRFGFGEATAAMFAAQRTVINGMEKDARYKNLYKALMDHGQLEHTLAREVLEGRRQKTSDYQGLYAKLLNGLSIPFSISERYNRGVTAIAAYDLAKNKGMSEADAIRYALDVTKEAHTSGMASTAPRWMQHPIGRVFFTFKSFVWNSAFVVSRAFYNAFKGESRDVRLAAQRQLLGMYGMATVFAGVKGMPFYGAASTMATMLHAMFGDDEPYDFDEEMRRFFGELFYKGFFNYLTNLEVANRAGIATDLIFRDDPRGIAEHGYVLSAMQQAFGPLGSYLVNAERGIKAMNDGHVERGVESLLPSWARNGLKGARYMAEGAVTLKGDPVSEDISAYNSLMQVIGFAPADLSSTYERLSAAKGYEREVNTKRTQLLNRYDMARHAGDSEMMAETRDMIQAFNQQFPVKRITADTLSRSIAARKAAEKQMINGVRFDKKLLPEIREKFFEDED